MTRAKATYEIGAVDKTKQELSKVEKNINNVDRAFKRIQKTAGLALGAFGVGAGLKAIVFDTADALDAVAKSANRMGESVKMVQGFQFATELAGASAADLELAWKTAGKNVYDAARGTGEGRVALEKLGISATDASGRVKSADQVMFEFADAISGMKNEAEITASAMKIFGESGTKLLPMFRQGSAAMREQIAEGRALSVVTDALARDAEKLKDNQLRLNRAFDAGKTIIAGALIPALSDLAESAAFKLLEVLTGIDTESRKSIESLSTLGEAEFFAAARDEAEGLAESISSAQQEIARLQESTQKGLAAAARNGREGGGLPVGLMRELDALTKQEEELRRLQALQERLTQIVDERAAKEVKQAEATEEARVASEKDLAILTKELDLEREKLASQLLQGEELDDQAKRREQAFKDIEEWFKDGITEPEIDISWMEEPNKLALEWSKAWESATATVAGSMARDLGDGVYDLITLGDASALRFEDMWKKAIASIAADLTEKLARKGLAALLGLIPGGSILGSILGVTAAPLTANAAARPALASGATYVQFTQQTLVPASTPDLVRAARTVRDSFREADRFAVAR